MKSFRVESVLVLFQYITSIELSLGIEENIRSKIAIEEFNYHEVITPIIYSGGKQVYTTSFQKEHLENITVVFPVSKNNVTVDLLLNRHLFSHKYIEKHYNAEGTAVFNKNTNNRKNHCYYHGHIRDKPGSIAALSTCNGISGYFSDRGEAYHIEPVESVISGKHYFFRDSDRIPKNLTCGQGENVPNLHTFENEYRKSRLKREVLWPYDATEETKIVELYIVNDFAQYRFYDYDIMKVIKRSKDIVNVVSSLYRPLGIYVALVGVETWTSSDKIEIVDNADRTMNNFLEYRRQDISPNYPNDNAQLITGEKLGDGVVGKAPIMTICSWRYSGGVNMDHSSLVGPVATTVAHEMGHNFGLSHDIESCQCPDERCIMAPSSGGVRHPNKWSSCSKSQFADAFHQGMDHCLHNLPESLYGSATCGNGFLEDGEECDCGLPEDCDTTCCDAATCKLTVNSTCATGACCDLSACKVKPATFTCREIKGECDLGEYCDGKSEHCPSDAFLQDGEPCTHQLVGSYCYKGKCQTQDAQCKILWGKTGDVSNDLCFEHFNIMGLANGHCGFDWVDSTFAKCAKKDVMCGMLHCAHRNEKLMFWKEALAYTMPEAWVMVDGQRKECKGAILDVGLDTPDPGMTPEGSKCAEGKLCVKNKCTAIVDLPIEECPDCHGQGVCNNLGQCHCNMGYAPPYCDKAGDGGSEHSGPMRINNGNPSLVIGICILFLVILPLIAVLAFFGYKHREKLKKLWSGAYADRYRSTTPTKDPDENSIYRARPRHDIENHDNRSPPSRATVSTITTTSGVVKDSRHVPNVAVVTPQRAAPALKPVRPAPSRPPGVTRTPSVTREDIGSPKLESHTNEHLPAIPTLGRNPSAGESINRPDLIPSHRAPPVPVNRLHGHSHNKYGHESAKKPERPTPPVLSDPKKTKPPSRPPPPRQESFGKSKKLPKPPPALPPSPPSTGQDYYENNPDYDPDHVYEPVEFVEVDLASPTDNTPFSRPSESQGPPVSNTSTEPSRGPGIRHMIGLFNNNPAEPDPRVVASNRTNGNNNVLPNGASARRPQLAPKPSNLKRHASASGDKPHLPPKPGANINLGNHRNRDSVC